MKEFKEVTFLAILLSTFLLAKATNQIGEKFRHDTSFDDIVSFDDKGSVTLTTLKETTSTTPKGTPTTPKGTTPTTPKETTPTTPKGTTPTTPKETTPTTPKGTTPKGTTSTTKGSTKKPTPPTPSTKSPPSTTTSKVSTSTTKQTTSTTTAKPTPPHCLPGQKRPVEGSCKNYTECDKSFNWVQKTCTNWCHNFNPKSLKCDWSWKYQCSDPTTTPCTAPTSSATPPASPNEPTASPGGSTIAPPSSTTQPSTKATTPATTTKVACTNGQSKVYQSGDCKDYLQCDSGKWVKKSCSWGFDFDINKLECRWSWWAKC